MNTDTKFAERRVNSPDYFSHIINEKLDAYNNSPLTDFHDHLLKIFFDLAQQYDGLDSFYQICVTIPQMLHSDISTSLAVLANSKEQFQLVSCSDPQTNIPDHLIETIPLHSGKAFFVEEGYLHLPVVSHPFADLSTIAKEGAPPHSPACLGMLLISRFEALSSIDLLFLEKLVTRIGYNFQRRLLQVSHLDHVNFLKRLGKDIGHNIIVPNMHFKNLFRQLEKKIHLIDTEVQQTTALADKSALRIINRCNEIRVELGTTHKQLLEHYNRSSLYLETLLREEHFSKGEFILKKRRCEIENDIILPELEIYRSQLEHQNISIEQPQNMQGRNFVLKGDLGLLSQVFDNLFSNAVKYTTATVDDFGNKRKAIAYGCKDVNNFPKKGKKGVKFNIFSTGEHLDEEESLTIFNDGVRGKNVGFNPGSGHGLAFVRNVVEIHGGNVGYEAVPGGNNFYFILPLSGES